MFDFYLFLLSNVTYTPGVSTTCTIPFNIVNYRLSLVIPYYLSTIANLYPIKQLKRLLFPQFGNPTKETLYFYAFYLKTSHYRPYYLPQEDLFFFLYRAECKF